MSAARPRSTLVLAVLAAGLLLASLVACLRVPDSIRREFEPGRVPAAPISDAGSDRKDH